MDERYTPLPNIQRCTAVTRFRTGKTKKRRTKMVVPIRVRFAGSDQPSQPTHTLDATKHGVRFAGFRGELKPEDIIEIQYRHERRLFRVFWICVPEKSSEKHVAAECVEFDKNIWGEEFPHQTDEYEEQE
jgi:hypothetical protein